VLVLLEASVSLLDVQWWLQVVVLVHDDDVVVDVHDNVVVVAVEMSKTWYLEVAACMRKDACLELKTCIDGSYN